MRPDEKRNRISPASPFSAKTAPVRVRCSQRSSDAADNALRSASGAESAMTTSLQPRPFSSHTSALPMNPPPPVTSTLRPCQSFCFSTSTIFLSFPRSYYTVPAFSGGFREGGARRRASAHSDSPRVHRAACAPAGPKDHGRFSRRAPAPDRRAQGRLDLSLRLDPARSAWKSRSISSPWPATANPLAVPARFA